MAQVLSRSSFILDNLTKWKYVVMPQKMVKEWKLEWLGGLGDITIIDTIFNDVEKENQVLELEEKDAQEDHEKFMEDAKARRAEESFDNFKRGWNFGGAIEVVENKIPKLESASKEDLVLKKQLESNLKKHKADKPAVKEAVARCGTQRDDYDSEQ